MKRAIIIKKIITVGKLNRCWCIVNINSGGNQTKSPSNSICSYSIGCTAVFVALFLILVLKLYQSRKQRSSRSPTSRLGPPFRPTGLFGLCITQKTVTKYTFALLHFCRITLFHFHSFALSFFHTFTYSHFMQFRSRICFCRFLYCSWRPIDREEQYWLGLKRKRCWRTCKELIFGRVNPRLRFFHTKTSAFALAHFDYCNVQCAKN